MKKTLLFLLTFAALAAHAQTTARRIYVENGLVRVDEANGQFIASGEAEKMSVSRAFGNTLRVSIPGVSAFLVPASGVLSKDSTTYGTTAEAVMEALTSQQNGKLTTLETAGGFATARASVVRFDGSDWVKRTGTAPTVGLGGVYRAGPAGTYYERQYRGAIDPRIFGAVGDGVNDDTEELQAALDFAEATTKLVEVPKGYWLFSQLVIPSGVQLRGVGLGHYGRSAAMDATVFVQKANTNKDGFVFRTYLSGDYQRISSTKLSDFILRGHNSNTTGHGIATRTAAGVDAVADGITIFENIMVREFPGDGLYIAGGVPVYVKNVNNFFNGGYGTRYMGLATSRPVEFSHVDGDGNRGGAALYVQAQSSTSIINIYGLRSEYRTNSYYGGGAAAQPYALKIGDFQPNGVVNVWGGIAMTSVNNSQDAADAVIMIAASQNSKIPTVNFYGCNNVNTGTTSGNGSTLYDSTNNVRVPNAIKTGTYSPSVSGTVGYPGDGITTFGGDGAPAPVGVGSQGFQVKGTQPVLSWNETDGSTDRKTWSAVVNAGELSWRTVNDVGSASIFWIFRRTGATVTASELNTPLRFRHYSGAGTPTTTQLPTSGDSMLWKNTTNGEIRWYTNDGGIIKAGTAFN